MAEKENAHKNHRKRLKTKVLNHGLECLAYHEILELLLTYAIPRVDTNPTAHKLINNFGNFANVIDADYHDLLKIEGVGKESALFINILSQFVEIYNKSKNELKKYFLKNTAQCVQFFRDNYSIKNDEYMILACLNKNKKVIKTLRFKGKDETEINFSLRQISNAISDKGVNGIVLFHTHPNGSTEPSMSDIETTQKVINVCMVNGVNFDDHIILNESEHFSFYKNNNIIEEMKSKYVTNFDTTAIYMNLIKK